MITRAASRPVPQWAHQALLAAAVWLTFLGTFGPTLQLNAPAWTPVHAHASLEGLVPAHTHAYDSESQTSTITSCAEPGTSLVGAEASTVICTADQDVTGAPALLAATGPTEVPLGPPLTAPALLQQLARYLAPSLPTLVPPPRG